MQQCIHILKMTEKDRKPTPASSAICLAVGDRLPPSKSVSVAVIMAARLRSLRWRRPSIVAISAGLLMFIT
jgi:hypothetical protein